MLTALVLIMTTLVSWIPAQTGIWTPVGTNNFQKMVRADLAYDISRARIVAIGRNGGFVSHHWEFDGVRWFSLPRIPHGSRAAVTYDSLRQRLIAVTVDSGALMRTWGYDGSTWVNLLPPTSPNVYHGDHEIVYDSGRDRVVLYINRVGSTLFQAQTWEFDGTDWLLRTNGGPSARYETELAYDPERKRTVLFGGWPNGAFAMAETWEWDGTSWIEQLVPGPLPRKGHAMAWDPDSKRIILYGGSTGQGTEYTDTWSWDGKTWIQVATQGNPGNRDGGGMIHDPQRNHLLLVGGRTSGTDTWRLRFVTPSPGTYESFGVGCPGLAGVPILDVVSGDRPHVSETLSLEITQIGNTLLNVPFGVLGSSNTTWQSLSLPASLTYLGFTGCTVYVSVDHAVPLVNVNGRATWDIQIPNDPTLAGIAFYVQALILDPGSTPGGAVVSNAGAGTIGIR